MLLTLWCCSVLCPMSATVCSPDSLDCLRVIKVGPFLVQTAGEACAKWRYWMVGWSPKNRSSPNTAQTEWGGLTAWCHGGHMTPHSLDKAAFIWFINISLSMSQIFVDSYFSPFIFDLKFCSVQKQPHHLSGQRLGNVRTRFCTFIKLLWQPRRVLSRPSLISRYPQAPADEVGNSPQIWGNLSSGPVIPWQLIILCNSSTLHSHIRRHVHYLYYLYLDIHSKYQSYSTSDTDVNIVNGWSHQPSPAQCASLQP